MKVAKKVRLLSKDKKGLFIKNDTFTVLRDRAVVEESVVEEHESNYKTTGTVYIVDEKATKERDEKMNPKAKKSN